MRGITNLFSMNIPKDLRLKRVNNLTGFRATSRRISKIKSSKLKNKRKRLNSDSVNTGWQ